MKIVNITDREQYNKFVSGQEHGRFLQSWRWGEFKREAGCSVRRLGVIDEEEKLLAVATLIETGLPLGGAYFYCPHGPVVDEKIKKNKELREEILKILLDEVRKVAKNENAIFLRLDPSYRLPAIPPRRDSTGAAAIYQPKRTIDIQPKKTLILDLDAPEEELLKSMHQKTRYNIRLAKKKGVAVKEGGGDDFERFWQLMRDTRARDGFRLHARDYYRRMLIRGTGADVSSSVAHKNELNIRLYLAEYENKLIAGNVVAFFGDTVTYMHGASTNQYRNVMAPYLLQWRVIELAREAGYKFYDFYGIDEKKWPGVTRFKRGFGGREVEYPGTYDLAFDYFYYKLYKLARALRRLI